MTNSMSYINSFAPRIDNEGNSKGHKLQNSKCILYDQEQVVIRAGLVHQVSLGQINLPQSR
jgi:hypothetical protein